MRIRTGKEKWVKKRPYLQPEIVLRVFALDARG